MREYETEQRKALFVFLEQNKDYQFTVDEIAVHLTGISTSAIYRNIGKLMEEGSVQRFQKDGSRKFLYQYVGDTECCHHIHLKCNSCGKIVHADRQMTNAILSQVAQNNQFQIDILKTVFVGNCKNCH